MKVDRPNILTVSSIPKFCAIYVLFFIVPSCGREILSWKALKHLTEQDMRTKYVEIVLNSSYTLFGKGKFDRIFVNEIGTISMGTPVRTADLRDVRNDVILFSPLLINAQKAVANKTISYLELNSTTDHFNIQTMFRQNLKDHDFTVSQAFAITFNFTMIVSNSSSVRNVFQIILAGNKDKMYVGYFYNITEFTMWEDTYARAGIFALRDGAIECSHEAEGSGTEAMSNIHERSNVDTPGAFIWRADLPLECTAFRSDCGVVSEPKRPFNVCPVGEFFETVTSKQWRFYTFYFCKAGRTLQDGSVTVKRDCQYDPDYYTYEWVALTAGQRCSKRIKNFWSNFHSSQA